VIMLGNGCCSDWPTPAQTAQSFNPLRATICSLKSLASQVLGAMRGLAVEGDKLALIPEFAGTTCG